MKNSLLVAVLSGVCCVSAAQTNVAVYGIMDLGVSVDNALKAGSVTQLSSGLESGSHIGFKGSEDLGSGFRALFGLEQGLNADTGASDSPNGTFSRLAYLGIASDRMGTLKLGRQYSPLNNAHGIVNPFEHGLAGDMDAFFATNSGNASLYQRMDNAINYQTADNLGGFKGEIAYGFGEQPGQLSAQRQVGFSVGYEAGPLQLVYAYHNANSDTALLSTPVFKSYFLGGSYDFGVAKLRTAMDRNLQGSGLNTNDYLIGVSVPFGASAVYADYMHKTNRVGSGTGASQYAVGYTYALSKRTNVYTAASFLDNFSNATLGGTDAPGKDISKLQAGIRHVF